MFLKVLENEARDARPSSQRRAEFEQSPLEIRMFNVGGGEAVLVVFPGNRAWLVDGGSSNSTSLNQKLGDGLVKYLQERNLVLETLVPSHPHIDHVGAVATILDHAGPRLASSVTIYRSADSTWDADHQWLKDLRTKIDALGNQVQVIALQDAHREVAIAGSVRAHFFAGHGDGPYTSMLFNLHFG